MKFFQSKFAKLPKHSRFEYSPRYYDPQKEEQEEREIKFGRAARTKYSGSNLIGKFRATRYVDRGRQSNSSKWYKMALLLGLMGVATAMYVDRLNMIVALGIILILLILFIRETNKL